jgi:exodeoxyribonuclease VII large subunit
MPPRAESAADRKDNLAEVSVSELSGALKRTVEDRFGHVRVRGEVSGWRGPHSSGHCYFALKDESAKIDAVMWKGTFQRLRVRPEEGMEVIATGKVTTYPGKSSYQIVIESIEPAGVGALLAQLEERRRRLAAEGLFDDARKQLLPHLPNVIGVVTSPTGAVIRDILHRIRERFPVRVIVWPVRVQGETCAAEVARAIAGFNALPEGGAVPRPDVIIVARGGGSLEDLWGFNDEIVVRAAAESMIPLVSAVGHETDWTLIDHAADVRAPTPTAAAEICTPVRADLLADAAGLARRLTLAAARALDARRNDLRSLARALPAAQELVAMPRQRLDRASNLLPVRAQALLRARALTLGRLGALVARHSPHAELARRRERLDGLATRLKTGRAHALRREADRASAARQRLNASGERLARAFAAGLERRAGALSGASKLLASFDHRNVLARGFALVRAGSDGALVRSAAALAPGQALSLEFADGRAQAVVRGSQDADKTATPPASAPASKSASKAKPRAQGRGADPGPQGDLF